jgi:hypothetical protein
MSETAGLLGKEGVKISETTGLLGKESVKMSETTGLIAKQGVNMSETTGPLAKESMVVLRSEASQVLISKSLSDDGNRNLQNGGQQPPIHAALRPIRFHNSLCAINYCICAYILILPLHIHLRVSVFVFPFGTPTTIV